MTPTVVCNGEDGSYLKSKETIGDCDRCYQDPTFEQRKGGRLSTAGNQRRSQRVLLQIRVILEVEIDAGNLIRLDAFTLDVNAHGGLLEMSLPLRPGQRLSLVNPTSGLKKPSRIVGLRRSTDSGFLVAFEFDSPTPKFWPIAFPPEDWQLEGG